MKKLLLLFLAFVFVTTNVFSDEHPIIKTSEVEKVVLEMSYDVGRFSGYIVFYDKDANQCAVKGKWNAYLKGSFRLRRFEKKLDISPSEFKTIEGDEALFAYEIKPFILEDIIRRTYVRFLFEWDSLKARTVTYVKN
ncbi:MAG: hypothetical protein ISS92_01905 [Candidatus Omnitrophica bacterium]|nr:hypothetical protein [Candidatus Omnitrophota bacterium]